MSLCAGWRGQRKAVLQLAWILLLKVTSVSRPVSWDTTCRGTLAVATGLYPGPTCRSSSSLRPNLPPEQRDTASLATRSLRVVAGPARAGEVDDCKYQRLAQLTSLGEEDAGQHIHPLVRVLLVRHQRPLALLQEVEDEELRVLRGLHADLRHGAQQVAEGGLGGGEKVNTDGGNPAAASPRPA